MHHVKPPGAIYMEALEDGAIATAIAEAAAEFDDTCRCSPSLAARCPTRQRRRDYRSSPVRDLLTTGHAKALDGTEVPCRQTPSASTQVPPAQSCSALLSVPYPMSRRCRLAAGKAEMREKEAGEKSVSY
jgi:hypothetical protein